MLSKKRLLGAVAPLLLAAGSLGAQTVVYTITTNADVDSDSDGFLSLREAMTALATGAAYNEAPAPGTDNIIVLQDGLGYSLGSALPAISVATRIEGNGARIFGGYAPPAPLLRLQGTADFSIDRLVLSSNGLFNSTIAPQQGAGIQHYGTGALTITNSEFRSLRVTAYTEFADPTALYGGAIISFSENFNVEDSLFSNCYAVAGNGSSEFCRILGGAIYLEPSSSEATASITRTQFERCSVELYNPNGLVAGGVIYHAGPGSSFDISESVFLNNFIDGFDAMSLGGLVVSGDSSTDFLITDTVFRQNSDYSNDDQSTLGVFAGGPLRMYRVTFEEDFINQSGGTRAVVRTTTQDQPVNLVRVMATSSTYYHRAGSFFLSSYGTTAPITLVNNTIVGYEHAVRFGDVQGPIILQNNILLGDGTTPDLRYDETVDPLRKGTIGNEPIAELTASNNIIGSTAGFTDLEFEPGLPNSFNSWIGTISEPFFDKLGFSLYIGGFPQLGTIPLPCSVAIDGGVEPAISIFPDVRGGYVEAQDGDSDSEPRVDIGAVELSEGWTNLASIRVRPDHVPMDIADGNAWETAVPGHFNAFLLADAIGYQCGYLPPIWFLGGVYYPNDRFGRPGLGSQVPVKSDEKGIPFDFARFEAFRPSDGMQLFGDFCGAESDPQEINGECETVFSGDIDRDGSLAGNVFNVFDLYYKNDISFHNLSITGGLAEPSQVRDKSSEVFGGGVNIANSTQILFSVVRFYDNYAESGGGAAYIEGSDVTFLDCLFRVNQSSDFGGAIYLDSANNVTISRCRFEENFAYEGGAIANFDEQPGNPVIGPLNVFVENTAGDRGGAIATRSPIEVTDSAFHRNFSGGDGGAIWARANLGVERSLFVANTTENDGFGGGGGAIALIFGDQHKISNSTFHANSSDADGGAIFAPDLEATPDLQFDNLTVVENRSNQGRGGGIFIGSDLVAVVRNTIFHSNGASTGGNDLFGFIELTDLSATLATDLTDNNLIDTPTVPADINEVLDMTLPIYYRGWGAPDFYAFEPAENSILLNAGIAFPEIGEFDQAWEDPTRGLIGPRSFGGGVDIGAKERGDLDQDNILDSEEKLVRTRGGSPVPNGDGTNANEYDYANIKVASFRSKDMDTFFSIYSKSLRLTNVGLVIDPSEGQLTPTELDGFPLGFVDFTLEGAQPDEVYEVVVFLDRPLEAGIFAWYKWSPRIAVPEPSLWPFVYGGPGTPGGIFTDANGGRDVFNLYFIDGQDGDTPVGSADGLIRDPGGIGNQTPLAVDLGRFEAVSAGAGTMVEILWETISEINNAGFDLYRASIDGDGKLIIGEKLNQGGLIPAQSISGEGATYTFTDPIALASDTEVRLYVLIDVELGGATKRHGPVTATVNKTTVSDWQWLVE